jgi:glutamine amidotransferase
MCRWITLLSTHPVSLSDIILSPSNSLIQLSKDASYHPEFGDMNNHVTNGDGFGVGWYHCNACIINTSNRDVITSNTTMTLSNGDDKDTTISMTSIMLQRRYAAVFKDTQPAWNNCNLRELCEAVQSDCIIAHVRAASVFAGISQQNCHPFKVGRLLFCHNGRIGNFNSVRRQFHTLLSDESYIHLKGTTDSETLFALLCTYLSQDGYPVSPYHQTEPYGHERLTAAVKKVLKSIEHILSINTPPIPDSNFSTLNFSITGT